MPLIYVELGRPRDFIKGGLNLVIGMLLIYKQHSFNSLYSFNSFCHNFINDFLYSRGINKNIIPKNKYKQPK